MPDKSAENLARIRACDADWNENDHPRADNGQFTSGSGGGGAKVSKLQSGGKAKVQQRPKIQAMRQLAQAAAAKPAKSIEQLENEYKDAFNRYAAFTENAKGLHDLYRNPEIYKQAMQMAKQKAIKAEKAYMKASEKQEKQAKPAAAPASKSAPAAKPAQAAKPTLQKLQQAMHSSSMMGDRAWLHLDGQDYVKIGRDKWEHHPSNSHALGGTYSSQQMMEKIGKAKKVDLYEPSAPAKPQPKAAKNNGGLESYKYKPPSKLEGFPIVMASKKTNSGLGGGNRFKFGFKKYKDGIMIRYVDDYWDSSDYAFVPLKNPTLENAYSYSDNASSKTVSALKDSLVTNEELGKIARQLK